MNSPFDAPALIDRLERFPPALLALVSVLSPEDLRWKPDPGSWSVQEIVCHLVDEETADFRARVISTLEDPTRPWTPIDPEGWAIERQYHTQDLHQKLNLFVDLRAQSIEILRSIASPDWSRSYRHPKIGDLSAGYMLSCWCAHDALHLRQITKRLHQLALRDGHDPELAYAGLW